MSILINILYFKFSSMELIANGKKRRISFKGTASSLIRKLNLREEAVVVKVNGKLVPENAKLSGNETVEIIKVVFGG